MRPLQGNGPRNMDNDLHLYFKTNANIEVKDNLPVAEFRYQMQNKIIEIEIVLNQHL